MATAPSHAARGKSRRRSLISAVVGLALVATGVALAASRADAALISGAITNVTLVPTNPATGSQVTTTIDYCVPNGTVAGDTFTLQLASELTNLPAGFALTDGGGNVVANSSVNPGPPAVATFTMTAYAETHQNVCGTAFFTSGFSSTLAPPGQTTPFTYVDNDGHPYTTNVTPTGPAGGNFGHANKFGQFTGTDQGRTNPVDFVQWKVSTPAGPFSGATITDTAPAGESIDCATVALDRLTIDASGTVIGRTAISQAGLTCTPSSIAVTLPALADNTMAYQLTFEASLAAGTGANSAPTTFTNAGAVVTTGPDVSYTPTASVTQSGGGGTGSGDTLAITKWSTADGETAGAFDTAPGKAVPAGTPVPVTMTISNAGSNPLTNVAVTDATSSGPALTGLSCDFSALGGPATGTTWAGPFAAGDSFECTGTVPAMSVGTQETDVATVTGTGNAQVTASNSFNSRTPDASPAISIVKKDAAGHDADTAATAADLGYAPAATGLVYTVTNTGNEALEDVDVSDAVVANGTVTGLNCAFPGGSAGVTWAGPFAPGASFDCTAQLGAVASGAAHQDVGTVTAVGANSGLNVTDDNPYYATAAEPVSLGDFVWFDANHNGVQDAGEVGVPNVTITLTDVAGQPVNDAAGNPVGPAHTDASGKYEFTELPAGQYVTHIDYSTAPAGYVPTVTGAGSSGTDSSTDSATSAVLAAGQQDQSLDYGLWQPHPAIFIVKGDEDGNAADTSATAASLPDGATNLRYTVTNTGDEPLSNVTVTDQLVANGTVTGLSCVFPDNSVGTTYAGVLAVGASFGCTAALSGVQAGADHQDIGAVVGGGQQSGTTVTDTNPYYAELTPRVSVGDYVWVDRDHDGIQDAGEPPLPGITLVLTGPNGQPVTDVNGDLVAPAVTDAQGKYHFDELPVLAAGEHYTVTVDQAASATALAGYRPTTAGVGTNRGQDSSTGSAASHDLTTDGAVDDTLDFGFVRPVSIGDYVWIDSNHNGVQDHGEKGVPSVKVTVTTPDGKPVTDIDGQPVGPATTDGSGHYEFTDLPPGQYVTHIDYGTAPDGYVPTLPGKGTGSSDSSTGSATSGVLESGGSDGSLDYGLWKPAPALSIAKLDAAGHDADTSDDAATLSDGSTGLVYRVTNSGDEALTDVKVSDQLVKGGEVSGLSCVFPDQSTGVTWKGPFAAGASFTCTAMLSGVEAGSDHEDLGVVSGVGQQSKSSVGAENPYFANAPGTAAVGPTSVDTGAAADHRLSPLLQAGGYALAGLAGLLALLTLVLLKRRRGHRGSGPDGPGLPSEPHAG